VEDIEAASVGTELSLSAFRAIEEQLLVGAGVHPIGASPSAFNVEPHQPALFAAEIATT